MFKLKKDAPLPAAEGETVPAAPDERPSDALSEGPGRQRRHYLRVFLTTFALALSFTLPYMIYDKGLFLYYGDFNVQMIPFAQLMRDSIRSGDIFWSWYTDLGSNFIGSYAFYNLGSPFFLITLFFPSKVVPYLIGPILCLKIAVMGTTAYAYVARFVKRDEAARFGGYLYAFSGFSIYNIFFYMFHDVLAFFPLLLIGMEELMVNRRRGVFALTVALAAFTNYFFFVAEAIFCVIYWFIRCFSPDWKPSLKGFLSVLLEAVLGTALTAVLLLPAYLQVSGNTRLGNYLSGWNLVVYSETQRLPDIVHSLFFPQDTPAFPNFFPDSNARWASMSAWLPMVSMTGVIAYFYARKGTWLKRLLTLCLVFALVPALNGIFVLDADSYYARWFFMPVLMMALATAVALDDPDIELGGALRTTALFTAGFTVFVGLIPKYDGKKNFVQLGLEKYPDRFWIYVAIVTLGLVLTGYITRRHRYNRTRMIRLMTLALALIIVIYGNYCIAVGKSYGEDGTWYKSVCLDGAEKISLEQPYNYRIDTTGSMDNQALFWRVPTMQCFNTVVSASIMEFYPRVGVTRDVGSRADQTTPGLRPFLSVKYCFDKDNKESLEMPGWTKVDEQLGFTVWENENYIPFGYTFDCYMTEEQFNSSSHKDRILLKALLLTDEQIQKYSALLSPLDTTSAGADYSDEGMAEDCRARNKQTCYNFSRDNYGFSASIDLSRDELVFFSVPYDKGWTATVNGKSAEIEKVDIGFMAVRVPAGSGNQIRFSYMTPGLKAGAAITAASAVLLIAYCIVFRKKKNAPVPAAAQIPPAEGTGAESGGPVSDVPSGEAPPDGAPSAGESPSGCAPSPGAPADDAPPAEPGANAPKGDL